MMLVPKLLSGSPFACISLFFLICLETIIAEFPPGGILVLFLQRDQDGLQQVSGTMLEGLNQFPSRKSSGEDNQMDAISNGHSLNGCPYTTRDALDLLGAMDKMVNSFYVNNAEKIMSGDGGFGLGVLNGQLKYLLQVQEKKLSPELKSFLEKLQKSSGALPSGILDRVKILQSDPIAVNGIEIIKQNMDALNGNSKWHGFSAITKHFAEFENIGNGEEVIEPSLNFKCLTSLMNGCKDSQLCKAAYTRDIYSQYMLTHQVLYQHISEQRSCPTFKDDGVAQRYRDRLCSKVYLEAEFLESHNFPTRFIDLFAEQVATCGLLGYPNFMRGDWLQEILSWTGDSSSPSLTGCMPNWYGTEETTDSIIRVKKVNRVTGGDDGSCDCLVHLTTVSLMAMSVNLRYMVDSCEPSLFEGFFQVERN